jgi:sulfite exporter TauE/SafE/plastocyanin
MDYNLAAIFTTGLLSGGLTCLAVQGGLLASTVAQRVGEKQKDTTLKGHALPILFFLIAKLVAYALLGALLGWFGSLFVLSIKIQFFIQLTVGIFMVGTALALLNAHPFFRHFIITPPKFVYKLISGQTNSKDFFAPALLGAFTVFVPCGTTQVMMALAIASGSPVLGATILAVFVLGTSPLFFTLGFLASKISSTLRFKFLKVAAVLVLVLASLNINNAIALSGSTVTPLGLVKQGFCYFAYCSDMVSPLYATGSDTSSKPVSEVTIDIFSRGYSPRNFSVKAGDSVTVHLVNKDGEGCTQAFTIPKLGIQKIVPTGSEQTFTFTAPKEPGKLAFSCSMGMYGGIINVN